MIHDPGSDGSPAGAKLAHIVVTAVHLLTVVFVAQNGGAHIGHHVRIDDDGVANDGLLGVVDLRIVELVAVAGEAR